MICTVISFTCRSSMGSAVERTDEHVREYLIYRGFTHTLKHLDNDIKADKEKGFRVQSENMNEYITVRGTFLTVLVLNLLKDV